MDQELLQRMFGLQDKVAIVTGGGGVLCSAMSVALARLGATVVVTDITLEAAQRVVAEIAACDGHGLALQCDVLDKAAVEAMAQSVLQSFGRIDILINGAGGNRPQATTSPDKTFFDLPADAVRWVFELNLLGIILPSQVIGRIMADQKSGTILNISSMNSFRPLTRIPAYSAAKAGVSNFTQWLAVYMAQEFSPEIRVNAIAPGFFRTQQNYYLLTDQATGELTARGRKIIEHTPMNRFGVPDDLLGAMCWLLSPSASFVSGVIIPIDGGFSAYSGV
jgi:NAD(P)-dependent dehydrogenase (short-subunit alcohol dehydrogenase family)